MNGHRFAIRKTQDRALVINPEAGRCLDVLQQDIRRACLYINHHQVAQTVIKGINDDVCCIGQPMNDGVKGAGRPGQ